MYASMVFGFGSPGEVFRVQTEGITYRVPEGGVGYRDLDRGVVFMLQGVLMWDWECCGKN